MKGFRLQALVYSLMIFLLLPVACNLSTAYAADSTPSADIRAKLEEFKKEYASKAAQFKELIEKKLQNKAYVGKVKSKSDQSITVATSIGPKIISLNQDSVYESQVKGRSKFSPKTLAEEDYIAGLGDVDETGVLTAKKIVLLPPINLQPKTYLWGQIISISDQLATLKDKDYNNKVVASFAYNNVSATLPDSPAVKLYDFVILTGRKNKNNIFKTDFIYKIPQGAVLKPKKMATPSAQTASPSAKPTSKKTN